MQAGRQPSPTMSSRRLSSLDSSFLRVESPVAHMHVAWKGRFTPRPGRPVTLDVLQASMAAVKREQDATLDDVALTVVAGALREPAPASGRLPQPSIGMFSHRDKLCFGGYAEPSALPTVDALPGGCRRR